MQTSYPKQLIAFVCLLSLFVAEGPLVRAESALSVQRHEIEVVSTFKIIKLCEWEHPHEDVLVIGVYENNDYFQSFQSSAESAVAKRLFKVPVEVVRLNDRSEEEHISQCDVIYCGNQSRKSVIALIERVEDLPILLVGSSKDFLGNGGMVSFDYSNGQLLIGINERLGVARGIRFRSSLLALASEVIR